MKQKVEGQTGKTFKGHSAKLAVQNLFGKNT